MVVAYPGCSEPGSAVDDFVYLHELMPTILDAAGVDIPDGLDGESFLPALLGNHSPNLRQDIYAVFHRHFTHAEQRMLRTRTHQFTFNSADQGELYDLVADPYQLNNVYAQPAYDGVRRDLMARMERYMVDLGDPLLGWFQRMKAVY